MCRQVLTVTCYLVNCDLDSLASLENSRSLCCATIGILALALLPPVDQTATSSSDLELHNASAVYSDHRSAISSVIGWDQVVLALLHLSASSFSGSSGSSSIQSSSKQGHHGWPCTIRHRHRKLSAD